MRTLPKIRKPKKPRQITHKQLAELVAKMQELHVVMANFQKIVNDHGVSPAKLPMVYEALNLLGYVRSRSYTFSIDLEVCARLAELAPLPPKP